MAIDLLIGLDPEETFSLRARLEGARRTLGDPQTRLISPRMYADIAQSLYLLVLATRHTHEQLND